jgi:hypothetical protein
MIDRSLVLNELRSRGSATVAELAETLQLDPHTITGILTCAENNPKDHVRKLRKVPRPETPRGQSVWLWQYVETVPLGVRLTVSS